MIVIKKAENVVTIAPEPTVDEARAMLAGDRPGKKMIENDGCKAPLDKYDERGLMMYCGEPKQARSSYCPAHTRIFHIERTSAR